MKLAQRKFITFIVIVAVVLLAPAQLIASATFKAHLDRHNNTNHHQAHAAENFKSNVLTQNPLKTESESCKDQCNSNCSNCVMTSLSFQVIPSFASNLFFHSSRIFLIRDHKIEFGVSTQPLYKPPKN